MRKIDIDEIIRAILEKSEDITCYLDKVNGVIVYVDENIAAEVEDEYEEAETAIEEWSADLEDDDTYHESIYSAPEDDMDEKEQIKRIRYTKQEDFEPIPQQTLSQFKEFARDFLDELPNFDVTLSHEIVQMIKNAESEEEIETIMSKNVGEKEKWSNYYEVQLREKAVNWLKSIGLNTI